MHSAPRSTRASTSSVAMTPVGRSSPQSSAASRPIFAELAGCTPTSSRSGLPMIARNECRPTLPVENWITLRIVCLVSLVCDDDRVRERIRLSQRASPRLGELIELGIEAQLHRSVSRISYFVAAAVLRQGY